MNVFKRFSRLVKFEHTLFALPFALLAFFFALKEENAEISYRLLILVIMCMVFARNSAMGFNRWLDREFDKQNPRTASREIPAGLLHPKTVLIFVIINVLLFIATTWFINRLCFYLSPVALFVILFYSYTKRITPLCHFVLSLGLAIAPVGAWLAVTGLLSWLPVLLGSIVFFWVSGFDIIYALQDEEFDKSLKLKSIPAWMGRRNALILSRLIHFITAVLVFLTLEKAGPDWAIATGSGIFTALLFWQHMIVKPNDLSKVNLAFFTTNGIASIIYGAFGIVSVYI